MTTPHERMRSLGDGKRLLCQMSDPTWHLIAFKAKLPRVVEHKAQTLNLNYPSLSQISQASQTLMTVREWLNHSHSVDQNQANCGASLDHTNLILGVFANASRWMRELNRLSCETYVDVAEEISDELVRQVRHVLRHYPSEEELRATQFNDEPLSTWMKFDSVPTWWKHGELGYE